MTSEGHFLGLVALVGSLRMSCVTDVLTVLDLGLTERQRRSLDGVCRFVTLPGTDERHPWLLSPFGTHFDPRGVVGYLDSDVIVTGPLDEVVAAAAAGSVCVGTDPLSTRWFAEWTETFALRAPLRREPYVNSGAVFFSTDHHPDLLSRWWELCVGIDGSRVARDLPFDGPTSLADQDALNAVLMSEVAPEHVRRFPGFVHDPRFGGVTVDDVHRLACRIGTTPTILLHSLGTPKPWMPKAWRANSRNAYVRCMREVVGRAARPGASASRVDAATLPLWLRPGPVGAVAAGAAYQWARLATWTAPAKRWIRARRAR